MTISRRHFLRSAAGVTLGLSGLRLLVGCSREPAAHLVDPGYGPPLPDPAGILDLPLGFRYQVISRVGQPMSDGYLVPGLHDGMAAFPGPSGRTVLVRNHEVGSRADVELGPFGASLERYHGVPPEMIYDPGVEGGPILGGTTTVVYDTRTQSVEKEYLSLIGTSRNCAGGPTPWNSWITCEETVERAGPRCARDHGYCFEVPATVETRLTEPVALVDMGRFNHEAVAVDPASGVVYETEDRWDSLVYRFLPNRRGQLDRGGRLQALAVLDRPSFDTRNWGGERLFEVGQVLPVTWIDVDGIDSPDDDLRYRGFQKGAARFARGEGMWTGQDGIFFACTNGGPARKGQIFRYWPSPFEGTPREGESPGRLELFVEPNDARLVENADNLTVAPWGDVIVCEDSPGTDRLVGITPEGKLYLLAHNALSQSELAGVTFSPDGSTLFVNVQKEGLTLAVTGPWQTPTELAHRP